MIGNISKGSGFGGAARYVLEKEGAEYLGGTFEGETWNDIRGEAAEFREMMGATKARSVKKRMTQKLKRAALFLVIFTKSPFMIFSSSGLLKYKDNPRKH